MSLKQTLWTRFLNGLTPRGGASQPSRRRAAFVPQFVQLEDRLTPAGNVSTFFDALGNFVIAGDNAANEIQINQNVFGDGTLSIAGLNGTTLNGRTDPVNEEIANRNVIIQMKDGDDIVLLNGAIKFDRLFRADLGTGNTQFIASGGQLAVTKNFVIVQRAKAGVVENKLVSIAEQLGDSVQVGGNFTFTSAGLSNDTLNVKNGTFDGLFKANLGQGDDAATIQADRALAALLENGLAKANKANVDVAIDVVQTDLTTRLAGTDTQVSVVSQTVGKDAKILNNGKGVLVTEVTLENVVRNFTVKTAGTTSTTTVQADTIGGNANLTQSGSTETANVNLGDVGKNVGLNLNGGNHDLNLNVNSVQNNLLGLVAANGELNANLFFGLIFRDAALAFKAQGNANVDVTVTEAKQAFKTTVQGDTTNAQVTANKVASAKIATGSTNALGGITEVKINEVTNNLTIQNTRTAQTTIVSETTVGGNLALANTTTGLGATVIENSTIAGLASLVGSNKGADSLSLFASIFDAVQFVFGDGADFFDLGPNILGSTGTQLGKINGTAMIDMGAGNDEVTLGGPTTIETAILNGATNLKGGGGTDTLKAISVIFDPEKFKKSSFEVVV